MSDQDDHTPAKIQQRDKGKLKEKEGNTAPTAAQTMIRMSP
jgi:hypothetical protein